MQMLRPRLLQKQPTTSLANVSVPFDLCSTWPINRFGRVTYFHLMTKALSLNSKEQVRRGL